MTLYQFKLLNEAEQYEATWQGAFIADRKEAGANVLLYDLGGFYVEVYFSIAKQEIVRLRTFAAPNLLEPYLDQIMGDAIEGLF